MGVDSKSKKNTIYSLIKAVTAIIFPLITFPYSSRVLGVENYGKINFASSFVSYFALLASLGLATYAIRECAKVKDNREELGALASKLLSINLLATIVSYLLLAISLIVSAFLREYFWLMCIYSFAIVFNTLGADWLNMALGDFKYITIRGLIMNVVSIVLMFIFVHKASDYIVFAIITVTASSGANLLNIFYRHRYCRVLPTIHMELKKYLPPILLMFSIIIVQEVFVSSDTVIIGFLLGDESVGLYGAATKIYKLPSAVTNSLTNVLLPSLAIAFTARDFDKIKSIQKYGINFLALIGFPCAAGLIVFSKEIIELASGSDYVGASFSLMILGIAYFISLLGMVVTNFNVIACGKDKLCFFACLISAAINIGLNFWLIPIYGINAAAFTTVLSHFIVLIIELPFIDKKGFDSKCFTVTIRPFICTAVLVGWLFLAKHFISNIYLLIVVGVVFGAIIYFSLCILAREEMTIDFLRNVINKMKPKRKETNDQ